MLLITPSTVVLSMRKVFFSFHYSRDAWRVSQVRNSWLIRSDNQASPFLDKAQWQEVKRHGDENIKKWILEQLSGTSVTVVLIGSETSSRRWVQFEIMESAKKRNGILGIYIHNLKNQYGMSDIQGPNPFTTIYYPQENGSKRFFSEIYPVYDWVLDNGRQNIGRWIETAALEAHR